MSRIKFLESTFGNSVGDTVRIAEETENEVYYFDSFSRWCYVPKSEEGKSSSRMPDRRRKERGARCHAKS